NAPVLQGAYDLQQAVAHLEIVPRMPTPDQAARATSRVRVAQQVAPLIAALVDPLNPQRWGHGLSDQHSAGDQVAEVTRHLSAGVLGAEHATNGLRGANGHHAKGTVVGHRTKNGVRDRGHTGRYRVNWARGEQSEEGQMLQVAQ